MKMDGYQNLTLEQLQTSEGILKLNEMLDKLFSETSSDGETVKVYRGYGSPESNVSAGIGSIYQRLDGGASTTLYVKESGTGATGWVAK